MQRTEKERVVAELAEQLRSTESLIVADYRGLTNAQLEELRGKLRGSGARLQVVKNTLTRRAAEEAGAGPLLALLEGPTAIAFVEADGDPIAVAKALSDTARETKVLALRGGTLSGRSISGAEVEELAKLPAPDVIKSQLVGVIVAPLTQLAGLLAAPVRDLVGLIDARIAQLEEDGDISASAAPPAEEAPSNGAPMDVAVEDAGEPETEAAAPADEVAAEATEETPEASDEANVPEDAENADTGTEEE
jgi:large subunit ribosomal protein L10